MRPASVPAVLLFDVMGTVVDMVGSVGRASHAVLAPLGFGADEITRLVADAGERLQSSMTEIVVRAASWRGHRALREAAWRDALSGDSAAPGRAAVSADVLGSLAGVVAHVDPWADSPAALTRLRTACRVVALSNADTAELVAMSAGGGLAWHGVLSAQAAQSYKPDPAVYLMAARHLDVEPATITMVAAHPWDLRAAAALGFGTAYVRRPDAERPAPTDAFDLEVADLTELADRFG